MRRAEAGLRQGETIALEWGDADLVAGVLTVRKSSWRGICGHAEEWARTQGPLTSRLLAALKAHRHLRSERVFCHRDGTPSTQSTVEAALRYARKRSGLRTMARTS